MERLKAILGLVGLFVSVLIIAGTLIWLAYNILMELGIYFILR